MRNWLFYTPESSASLRHAVDALKKMGVDFTDTPCQQVTHLLLPVPCRLSAGQLSAILQPLPETVTVVGGFLRTPEIKTCRYIDLLQDPCYQAQNAMITAHCALRVAEQELTLIWPDCPVLVLGWGRIGKCLSKLLQALGAPVAVAARKDADRAMCAALGYDAVDIRDPDAFLPRYRVIFNTVPAPVLRPEQVAMCRTGCSLIELASIPGIAGEDVIDGRALPGKLAPLSAGCLIARTVMRLCTRKEMAL